MCHTVTSSDTSEKKSQAWDRCYCIVMCVSDVESDALTTNLWADKAGPAINFSRQIRAMLSGF